MNDNKHFDTVVILASVNWDHVQQAMHALAYRFAKDGHEVIWVEPLPHRWPKLNKNDIGYIYHKIRSLFIKKSNNKKIIRNKPSNISVISSFAFPETIFTRFINNKLFYKNILNRISVQSRGKILLQVWKPLEGYEYIRNNLSYSVATYCCTDDYAAQNGAPKHMSQVEERIVSNVDIVFAKTKQLIANMSRYSTNVHFRDTAVDYKLFSKADTGITKKIEKLGFYGVISDRLDFDFILKIADLGYEIHLLGPVKRCPWSSKKPPHNIYMHGAVAYEKVPEFVASWSALLFPYKVNKLTNNSRFMKLFECFATGKPIVSRSLPTLIEYDGLIYFCDEQDNISDFFNIMKKLETKEKYIKRKLIAKSNGWGDLYNHELGLQSSLL